MLPFIDLRQGKSYSIAIELLLHDGQRKFCGFVWFDRDRTILLALRHIARVFRPFLVRLRSNQISKVTGKTLPHGIGGNPELSRESTNADR